MPFRACSSSRWSTLYGTSFSARLSAFSVSAPRRPRRGGACWYPAGRTPSSPPRARALCPVSRALSSGSVARVGAALGFLGLGAKPPSPEWGVMISDGQNYILTAWWLSTLPGIAIVLVGVGFSLLGDGLADLLRPGE